MKRIGLIGGLSWESTRTYYDVINTTCCHACEGNNPEILMYSVQLSRVYPYIVEKRYDAAGAYLCHAAQILEQAGADLIVICANTPHILAPVVQQAISVPLVHIADATAEAIREKQLSQVALLGTPVTMGLPFYKDYLERTYNITTMVPDEQYHKTIETYITTELDKGILKDETRQWFLQVIEHCKAKGAQGIILGCTEIPLLVKQEHCDLPVFDTATIHAEYAARLAME